MKRTVQIITVVIFVLALVGWNATFQAAPDWWETQKDDIAARAPPACGRFGPG